MKILLADDDADQLELRSKLLRHSGFETYEAIDLASALRLARAESPDCAVIDLRFPTDRDGFQLVRELKRLDSSIHVVVLTGVDPARYFQRPEMDLIEEIVLKGSSSTRLIEILKALAPAGRG